jgi:hypothetical protein
MVIMFALGAYIELVVAILATRGGALSDLLGTERLTGNQWLLAIAPAAALFALWELGELIARRRAGSDETASEASEPVAAAA